MKKNKTLKGGCLQGVQARFQDIRIGELLVSNGHLKPSDLRKALKTKAPKTNLGRHLLNHNLITRQNLYKALGQQWILRGVAACLTVMISLTCFSSKSAKADSYNRNVTAGIQLASAANAAFKPATYHAPLFGSQEQQSKDISAFTKWRDMFARFEKDLRKSSNARTLVAWRKQLGQWQNLPLHEMAMRVNSFINGYDYIIDKTLWNKTDFWATPFEFFARGGDCEDFAIAKYASLKALGVPESRLRIAIVHDKIKDIPHAVLIVYTDKGALILDNQSSEVKDSRHIERYNPIYTINQTAWWLHTAPGETVLASAQ